MRRSSLIAGAVACAAAVSLVAGCGSSVPEDFTVIQAPPRITDVDLTDAQGNRGDLYTFEAGLTRDGKPFGMLLGQTITAGAQGIGDRPRGFEERIANLVFRLPGGTITATGASFYPTARAQLPPEKEQVRVITGGSGDYIGVGGEVRTVRQPDGTYQQAFRFVD